VPPHRCLQLLDAAVPTFRILLDRLEHDRIEVATEPARERRWNGAAQPWGRFLFMAHSSVTAKHDRRVGPRRAIGGDAGRDERHYDHGSQGARHRRNIHRRDPEQPTG